MFLCKRQDQYCLFTKYAKIWCSISIISLKYNFVFLRTCWLYYFILFFFQLAYKVFMEVGLFETFRIPVGPFLQYFHALESGYRDKPCKYKYLLQFKKGSKISPIIKVKIKQ